jgi:hypothetical protein
MPAAPAAGPCDNATAPGATPIGLCDPLITNPARPSMLSQSPDSDDQRGTLATVVQVVPSSDASIR